MPHFAKSTRPIPIDMETKALRQEWRWIALLGTAILTASAAALSIWEGLTIAQAWWVASVICWAYVLWQCHRRLHLNHSTIDDRTYPHLGHGNRITLLRGWCIAATAGFLTFAWSDVHPTLRYLSAALYSLAVLGDALDGYMARRQRQTTQLGAELDTVLDAFGLVVAPLLAVLYGKLHVSYLLVSTAYYLFQGGIHWRQWRGLAVYPLPPSRLRRYLAGTQMALVAMALWPMLPPGLTRLLGVVLMVPLLLGFCRDWLHVSGRLTTTPEPPS